MLQLFLELLSPIGVLRVVADESEIFEGVVVHGLFVFEGGLHEL